MYLLKVYEVVSICNVWNFLREKTSGFIMKQGLVVDSLNNYVYQN